MAREANEVEQYFAAKPKSRPRYGLLRTCFQGKTFEFLTASGVFSKHHIDLGTRLLIESMSLPKKGCVLDMGCGYGPVGIAAAVFNPSIYVVLVDINFRAVWLAKQNLQRNFVRNAEVRRGCLYAPVEDFAFDCVLSNPPVSAGLETVKAIIVEAPKHMTRRGVFQMVVKSKVGGKRLCTIFERAFGSVDIMARQSGYRVLRSQKP